MDVPCILALDNGFVLNADGSYRAANAAAASYVPRPNIHFGQGFVEVDAGAGA